MNQDIKNVRTAQDLERKYLTQLLGLKTAVQKIDSVIYKTDTIILDFLAGVGVYRNQVDKLTTWFFATDFPESANQYDLGYDADTGKVYQYDGTNWNEIEGDGILTSVLAIANAQADTSNGYRQIFYTQPTPTYFIGDVWIDGSTIKRSRIKRIDGDFDASDWILQENYTEEMVTKDTTAILNQLKTNVETNYATRGYAETTSEGARIGAIAEITQTLQNYATNESVTNSIQQSAETIYQNTYIKNEIKKIVNGNFQEYNLTNDTNYKSGKTYYSFDGEFTYTALVEGVDYNVGDLITGDIYEMEIIEVTSVTSKTGTFDDDGLTIDKTGTDASPTKSNLDTDGLSVIDKTGATEQELLFAGYDQSLGTNGETIVRTINMLIKQYLSIYNEQDDTNGWRVEVVHDSTHGVGLGFYYIGG